LTTTALVTGASGGIGAEVARQLAATGVTVVVSARSVDRAKATAESIDNSVQVLPVGLDVADPESVQSAAAALAEEPGRLDILINNAAAYVDWGGIGVNGGSGRRPYGDGGQPVRRLANDQRAVAPAAP
jgi:NADP-dependent 3-hydroxy acid dehydrogenase YdfG